ncbi:MAG: recombinase RecA, partial [Anaerolineae bacterium]
RGSFYYYEGQQLAQGRENAKLALREDPQLGLRIENVIRKASGLPEVKRDVEAEESAEPPDEG